MATDLKPTMTDEMTDSMIERDMAHSMHPWADIDMAAKGDLLSIERAEGVYLYDTDGNRYLDAVGGLWCTNIGAGREEMAEAIADQVRQLSYSNTFVDLTHPVGIELSEKVTSLAPTGLNHILFTTGGSTAVDTAFRLIHCYQNCRGLPEKKQIISRKESFHGSTYAAISIGGKTDDRMPEYDFIEDGIQHISAPDDYRRPLGMEGLDEQAFVDALVREFEDQIEEVGGPGRVAAFFAEPVMGAGGVLVPPPGYLQRMAEVCKRNDILFVADEVVTGFGRLGHWFASEDVFRIQPDIVTCAKGITSGYLPLGGTLLSDEIHETLYEPGHGRALVAGFTNTAHPVCCRAALKNIEIIEREGILEHVREIGPYLGERLATLSDLPIVGNVRGHHLMMCVEFVKNPETREAFPYDLRIGKRVSDHADARGLMVRPIGALNVMSPALIITRAEIDFLVDTLRASIEATTEDLIANGEL